MPKQTDMYCRKCKKEFVCTGRLCDCSCPDCKSMVSIMTKELHDKLKERNVDVGALFGNTLNN